MDRGESDKDKDDTTGSKVTSVSSPLPSELGALSPQLAIVSFIMVDHRLNRSKAGFDEEDAFGLVHEIHKHLMPDVRGYENRANTLSRSSLNCSIPASLPDDNQPIWRASHGHVG